MRLHALWVAIFFVAQLIGGEPPAPKVKVDKTQVVPRKAVALPEGASKAGWEALIKNDFAGAEKEFGKVLESNPGDLDALEGLRWASVSQGKFRETQNANLKLVAAAAKDPLAHSFILRCMDALAYVESRAELIDAFGKIAPESSAQIAAHLRDQVSHLYYRAGRYADARKMLEGNGYIDRWVFATGPFGEKDRNNTIEKRFPPERALKSLEFKDEKGAAVKVIRDLKNMDRDLDLDSIFDGARGIFYVMANLKSEEDVEVNLAVTAPYPYRLFLRGMPISSQPDDDAFSRTAGQLIRVKLTKGNNPLFFKLGSLGAVMVRVSGPDFQPLSSVTPAGLTDEELASIETSSVRGYLLGEKAVGSSAGWFLKKYGKVEDGVAGLRAVAENAPLSLPEAVWLGLVVQRENDHVSNEILARRMLDTYPDSVAVLDLGASMLGSAGRGLGNSEARQSEEARRLRERALTIVPNSHQHLIALTDFYNTNDQRDQAFAMAKKCAEAHPQSGLAQVELARQYQSRNFLTEAEKYFEAGAKLDAAYLPALQNFHAVNGSHARARELLEKERELGMLNADTQYNLALRREDYAEAERLLGEEEKWFPERKEFITTSRAQLLEAKGDLLGAYEIHKSLSDTRAGRRGRDKHLGPMIDLALRLGKMDEAKKLLNEQVTKHPNDLATSRRLSDLNGSEEKHWWEQYDMNVSDIDTSKFSAQNYPAANHAWIVDFMVLKIMPDLSTQSYTHIAQKVLNLRGIGEISEVMTRAKSKDIVFIRTLNPDGSSYMPQNIHDFQFQQSASLYKVGPGSILERAYLEQTAADEDEPFLMNAFNFNAIDAPRAVSRWVVMVADAAKDKLDIQRIRPELLEEKIVSGPPGYTVYQWTNKQVEGIKGERFMPREADREAIPTVTIESKVRPSRANRLLMQREVDRIPEEAKEKAKQIAKAAAELPENKRRIQEAQFEAIVLWVRNNIETGSDSRTLDDVWYSRSGMSSQMLTLAGEMSRAAGLVVNTAQVNGSYLPGRNWVTKNARRVWEPAQLSGFGSGGTMLVCTPLRGHDIWAQFNGVRRVKFYSPFDLAPMQSGALALVYSDGGDRITRVMGERLGLIPFKDRAVINLASDGVGTVHSEFQVFGLQAGSLRETLTNPQQREPVREFVARRSWPSLKSMAYEIIGEEDVGQPLQFKMTGRVTGIAEKVSGGLFLPAFPEKPRVLGGAQGGAGLRGPVQRENDVVISDENFFSDFDRVLEYNAPNGWGWTEVPDDIFICTEFGFFMEDFNVKGRTLYCTRACLIPAQRITPEKHAAFQEFLSQIYQHHELRIGCSPLKAESFGGAKREIFSGGYATGKE